MSKLDGNERWKSKMLLTEHQEQYESRNSAKQTGRLATEEWTMVRDVVLLPAMLSIIQKSMEEVRNSDQMFKRVFEQVLQILIDRVSRDLYDMRREMGRRNIKVSADEQVDLVVYYRVLCRGYEERFGIVREVMRAEIGVRLARYVAEVTKALREHSAH